ncbi:RagB/SusD family nutrient uptake outer membrane protein [Sphingobacterium endophyticum]|uniref:RagB/SusD family nutrient uptake outer membrane protein n=1 Tax=Sphingobacterium endophyticum TaxID=2546448 RepID=UPI0012E3234A|nr:RagB/SusD family nutrient uptake outer membrane protein [Sphingobacterium endophyticum]
MKNIKKYFACILVASATFVSCENQIFEEPYSSLSPSDIFSDPSRVEKAAVGMYDALQNPEYLGGRALIYADIRGIDCGNPTYFGDIPSFTSLNSSNGTVGLAWTAAYRTINESNLFVKNITANSGVVSAEKEKQFIAEAKFIRSLSYFYLVNLWAQPYGFTAGATHLGVPLVLTSSDAPFSPENQIPRNTVKEVYDQMIKDLEEAVVDLPASSATPTLSSVARATKGAAYGLLARINLYKKDYAKALEYANKVEALKVFQLNASPAEGFDTYITPENIFSVAHNGGDNPNTNHALGQHYAPTQRADIQIDPKYVALMSVTDLRRTELVKEANGAFWTAKYTRVSDWAPIMRYSEILLIKAEALANIASGVDANAVALVNQVRSRSKASTIAPATKAELVAAILNERRIELAFEGQGLFEFLRTGRNLPAHSVVPEYKFGNGLLVFPLPLNDVQRNPKLVQNEGY